MLRLHSCSERSACVEKMGIEGDARLDAIGELCVSPLMLSRRPRLASMREGKAMMLALRSLLLLLLLIRLVGEGGASIG